MTLCFYNTSSKNLSSETSQFGAGILFCRCFEIVKECHKISFWRETKRLFHLKISEEQSCLNNLSGIFWNGTWGILPDPVSPSNVYFLFFPYSLTETMSLSFAVAPIIRGLLQSSHFLLWEDCSGTVDLMTVPAPNPSTSASAL